MENEKNKHYRSFWPIVIIAALSALVGGFVVWAVYNSNLDEDVSNISPMVNRRIHLQIEAKVADAVNSRAQYLK